MSAGPPVFRVRVHRNIVVSICGVSRDAATGRQVFDDRLAVSTELARNNLVNGCFDGDYFLADFDTARNFAALCLGFMKNLCEASMEAIDDIGGDLQADWINPHAPQAGRTD